MAKSILVFLLFALAFLRISAYVEPGEITIENFSDERIASGVAGKKGENLDFCYLSINFYQKRQTCGCVILAASYVMTSARCVVDCSEDAATNVTVTFPQKSGKEATRKVRKIYVPDGVDSPLPKYDKTMEVPQNKFHAGSNVGILELESPILLDKSVAIFSPAIESSIADILTRAAKGNFKYRACGVGTTDNKGTFSKGVFCTDVNLVASDKCKNPSNPEEVYEVPETFACLQWTDVDKNLCVGDFGGPIWIYEKDPKGAAINQEVFCIAVGSPDVRASATCLDGHTVYCQFQTDALFLWAASKFLPLRSITNYVKSVKLGLRTEN